MKRDSFVGTWELDPQTLAYQHGRPGRQAVYRIEEIPEGLRFTLDGQDADGNPFHFAYEGKLDGADVPLPGTPLTLALIAREDGTVESIARREGRVVDRWTRRLSEDGESMTITQHGVTPEGKEFANSGVYRRTA